MWHSVGGAGFSRCWVYRVLYRLAWALLLTGCCNAGFAATDETASWTGYPVADHASKRQRLPGRDVTYQMEFARISPSIANPLTTDKHIHWDSYRYPHYTTGSSDALRWIKLTITHAQPGSWIVQVPWPFIHGIEAFVERGGQLLSLPAVSTSVFPAWQLSLADHAAASVLFRFNEPEPVFFTVAVHPKDQFNQVAKLQWILPVLIIGALCSIALYNAVIGMVLREGVYLYFSTFQISIAIFVLLAFGLLDSQTSTSEFLPLSQLSWMAWISFVGAIAGYLFFTRFLQVATNLRWWVAAVALCGVSLIALGQLSADIAFINTFFWLVMSSVVLLLQLKVAVQYLHARSARVLLVGWCGIMLTGILALANAGFRLQSSVWYSHAQLAGILFQSLLLSISLSSRMKEYVSRGLTRIDQKEHGLFGESAAVFVEKIPISRNEIGALANKQNKPMVKRSLIRVDKSLLLLQSLFETIYHIYQLTVKINKPTCVRVDDLLERALQKFNRLVDGRSVEICCHGTSLAVTGVRSSLAIFVENLVKHSLQSIDEGIITFSMSNLELCVVVQSTHEDFESTVSGIAFSDGLNNVFLEQLADFYNWRLSIDNSCNGRTTRVSFG